MSTRGQKIFSGEPLPVPPRVDNAEIEAFHRKLIDYLRRLTAKIGTYVDDTPTPTGGETHHKVFVAYPSETNSPDNGYGASGSLGVPATEIVRWQNTIRSDSIYSYDSTYAFITVSETGTYVVHCDILTTKNFATTFRVVTTDALGVADGNEPVYGEFYPYLSGSASGDSMSFMVPVELTAGQRIAVEITTDDQIIQHEGSRLFIEKMEDET